MNRKKISQKGSIPGAGILCLLGETSIRLLPQIRSRAWTGFLAIAAAVAVTGVIVPRSEALLQVPEPDTVVYGKVINRAGGHSLTVTAGNLQWTLGREGQESLTFEARLQPIADGEYSYRLNLPHRVLSSGLQTDDGTIPLSPLDVQYQNLQVIVDGLPARILNPEAVALKLSQPRRAFTHRIDLEVTQPLPDSDEDGIPDWWENLYGLDKDDAGDAAGDGDADGRSNLEEFQHGSSPEDDNTVPQLNSTELVVYAQGRTGVLLDVDDTDSGPEQIQFVLRQVPAKGRLLYYPESEPAGSEPYKLIPGTTFRLADVNQGRLVYEHSGDLAEGDTLSFTVTVNDQDHAAQEVQIALVAFDSDLTGTDQGLSLADLWTMASGEPLTADADKKLNFLIAQHWNMTIWDGAGRTSPLSLAIEGGAVATDAPMPPGSDAPKGHLLIGSAGNDDITGGPLKDLIEGGFGDDQLKGGAGPDLFFWKDGASGSDVLSDFDPAQGDTIDLSLFLVGSSDDLTNYVQIQPSEAGTVLALDQNGDGSGFDDLKIVLPAQSMDTDTLYAWLQNGTLEAGGLDLTPRVGLYLVQKSGSENGPREAVVEIVRTGSLDSDLEVVLAFGGSALNGIDYMQLGDRVRIPAGSDRVQLGILPYADQQDEPTEAVQVRLLEDAAYEIQGSSMVVAEILDLLPEVSLEVLEPMAVRDTGAPAALLLKRTGVLDHSLLLRLDISGTARAGTDYESIPSYVTLAAGEGTKVLEIRPVPAEGADPVFVRMSIQPDPSFLVTGSSSETVFLISEPMTFASWMHAHFPGNEMDPEDFSEATYAGSAITNLEAYAYGVYRVDEDEVSVPRIELIDGRLTVVFRRPLDVSDLQYIVEVSNDLVVWKSDAQSVETSTLDEFAGDPEVQCFRSVLTTEQTNRLFMRVRVRYVP